MEEQITREQYRTALVMEKDKQELANNCRLVLDRFFLEFKPKVERKIYYIDVLRILKPLVENGVSITWADSQWSIFDLESVKELNKYSWWKQDNPNGGLTYDYDIRDCDDFAEFSKSMIALFWKTNSVGRCMGSVTYNGVTTPHAFDIILAIDSEGEIRPYLFDTQFNIEPTLLTSNKGSVNQTFWTITNIRI